MKAFILLLALLIQLYSSAKPTTTLLSIDLELDENKIYRIKTEEDETLKYFCNYLSFITIIPKKYFDLIKGHLQDNQFKCKRKLVYSAGFYETFYCPDSTGKDFSKIKLHLNFEGQTVTMYEQNLFESENNRHYSRLRTQSGDSNFVTLGFKGIS